MEASNLIAGFSFWQLYCILFIPSLFLLFIIGLCIIKRIGKRRRLNKSLPGLDYEYKQRSFPRISGPKIVVHDTKNHAPIQSSNVDDASAQKEEAEVSRVTAVVIEEEVVLGQSFPSSIRRDSTSSSNSEFN